jgi:UDP-N-acetylglucosamine 2-epimerase (non-hydrolysing)
MNTRKKLLFVFGTRPEAIKMAPLIKKFEANHHIFETIVCVTGQHREMLDQVLDLFEIKPAYDLDIMRSGQDLFDVTSRVLLGMRTVLLKVKPDTVFVHGDTSTSMSSALAAFYQQIPVVHIEAGLRTRDINSPWPEEMNRQLTGRIASHHFCPTHSSRQNLLDEGVKDESITVTGNTVIDALYMVIDKIESDLTLLEELVNAIKNSGYDVSRLSESRKLILITGHRRENFGEGFINICKAIKDLTHKYPECDFVYPMHLNPNVRTAILNVFGIENSLPNMFFIEPLEYPSFVFMMKKSYLILTDSGGVQEEAPSLGIPVLVMRDTTERPEAVDAGTVILVGTNYNNIITEVSNLINNQSRYEKMSRALNPYGNGVACDTILNDNFFKII